MEARNGGQRFNVDAEAAYSPHSAAAATTTAMGDPYDDRHRQSKALAQYERQKAAWSRMQAHLTSATTPPSSASLHARHSVRGGSAGLPYTQTSLDGGAPNMTHATAVARAKREDFTILHAATAESHLGNGSHAWEGLLRCSSAQDARRLVPIGRTCVPYPLYSELHDPSSLPDDHLSFARVVSEEDAEGTTSAMLGQSGSGTWNATTKSMKARTAAQEHVMAALAESKGKQNSASAATRKGLFADSVSSRQAAHLSPTHEDVEHDLTPASYYEEQLKRFAPYVQQRLGHFLQPRTFLRVDGQPAPYATDDDVRHLRETAGARPDSAPPVEYFPPPPQTQLWAASAGGSRAPSRNGHSVHAGGKTASMRSLATTSARRPTDRLGQTSATEDGLEMPRGSIDTAEPHRADYAETERGDEEEMEKMHNNTYTNNDDDRRRRGRNDSVRRTPPPSPLHPMRVLLKGSARLPESSEAYSAVSSGGASAQVGGPAMELSTRCLFFQTVPHELLQGSATLRNTGTTTIYYSWAIVDAMHEHLRDLFEAQREGADADDDTASVGATSNSAGGDQSGPLSDSKRVTKLPPASSNALPLTALSMTHQLAAHQHAARESFFFMSAPLNGVVLPGDALVIPFSVRATREGLFQSTYELLTVPPAPERIFVQLRALVQRAGPPLRWLAAPVAEALEAKVQLDAQRRVVQALGTNSLAMEKAELRARIAEVENTAAAAQFAERQRRQRQEAAWHHANRLTFDHVPYHPAVYDKLSKLSDVVRETYTTLSQPDDKQEEMEKMSDVATTTTNAPPLLPPSSTVSQGQTVPSQDATKSDPASVQWDGALLPLLYQILSIRDNALRQTFFEAMQVLLRAARASRDVPATHAVPATGQQNDSSSSNEQPSEKSAAPLATNAEEEEDEEKEVSLSSLLSRAATALADVVVARQASMVEKQCEDFLLQPVKPSAALTLMSSPAADAGAGKGRSTSAAATTSKKSVAASKANTNSARGAAAEAKDHQHSSSNSKTGNGAGGTQTPAQRLLESCIPSAALQGFSVAMASPDVMTTLRAVEEDVVRVHMEAELQRTKAELIAVHTARFREVVDAACDRGPLATCTPSRLAELRQIQQSAPLVVDAGVDPLVAPPVTKPGKRK